MQSIRVFGLPFPSGDENYRLSDTARPLWRSLRRCRRSRSLVEPLLRVRRQPGWFGCAKTGDWRQRDLAVGLLLPRASSPFLCKSLARRQSPSA